MIGVATAYGMTVNSCVWLGPLAMPNPSTIVGSWKDREEKVSFGGDDTKGKARNRGDVSPMAT